jgi:tripartite-type tricarboxylate transporter receptor subunit TctC
MPLSRRRFCTVLGGGTLALGLAGRARAQAPALKVLVVVPPGASMDIVARLVAEKLKLSLNRPVIVDYKVGGTGIAAAEFLKRTDADGSHLLFAPTPTAAFAPFLYSKLNYDPDTDLAPVSEGVETVNALCVNNSLGIASFKDFIEAVRRDPKLAFVGTSSLASIGAFLIVLMRRSLGVDLQLVPYKGGQPLVNDLLGNQIPAGTSVISDYLVLHRAGRLRLLAHGGSARPSYAPEIPTYAELGYPDLVGRTTIGFFARGGTPPKLIAQLSKAVNDALKTPDVEEHLKKLGLEPVGGAPEDYQKTILSERNKWGPIAKEAGIKID